ncbi:MAG: glycosyltransferase family 4 protein [Endomicrobiales bacterium]
MRIGIIVYDDLNVTSGGYLYDRKLVEHFRRAGDTVEVITLRRGFHCLAHNFSPRLFDRLRNGAWDVLLQDELVHPSLFLLNRRLRGEVPYPLLSIVHHLADDEPAPPWKKRMRGDRERSYLNSVDGFIFNSRAVRQRVESLVRVPVPSVLAYPGRNKFGAAVTPEVVRERALGNKALQILFLGNVIPRKGLHVLLEALSRISAFDWQLNIAGSLSCDRAYVHSLFRLIVRRKLVGSVSFHGALPDEALGELLRESHLLAVPSLYEGFGIAYLEALGCGLPVIASSAGGAREIVEDGREGFLIEPGDAAALRERIERLGRDRERLRTMGLDALRRFADFPVWNTSAAIVRDFLERVKRGPGAGRNGLSGPERFAATEGAYGKKISLWERYREVGIDRLA